MHSWPSGLLAYSHHGSHSSSAARMHSALTRMHVHPVRILFGIHHMIIITSPSLLSSQAHQNTLRPILHMPPQQHATTSVPPHLQVYASYNYRRDLTTVAKLPGMLSRARSLSREEAESQEADVGKADVGVGVHPPTMRQAIAWELAMRNIRQSEVRHVPMYVQHVVIATKHSMWLNRRNKLSVRITRKRYQNKDNVCMCNNWHSESLSMYIYGLQSNGCMIWKLFLHAHKVAVSLQRDHACTCASCKMCPQEGNALISTILFLLPCGKTSPLQCHAHKTQIQ